MIGLLWTVLFVFSACIISNRHGRWYIFAGLIDATLASGLFTAAYFHSTFLPEPLWECRDADVWPYNQTYNSSALTIFEVLGGNATAAEEKCSDLVTVWALETSMG